VDISARLLDIAIQDSDKVRQFFIDYADRILFGTDVVMRTPLSSMDDATRSQALQTLKDIYQMHFAYFERGDTVTVRGRATRGIDLPGDVLTKFYRTNAETWYPGIN
jgi:predicted TIM-barrel fold metal-dependent hydrolase